MPVQQPMPHGLTRGTAVMGGLGVGGTERPRPWAGEAGVAPEAACRGPCSTEWRRSGSLVQSQALEPGTLGRPARQVCLWSDGQREPQWAKEACEIGLGPATWNSLQVRTTGAGFVIWGHGGGCGTMVLGVGRGRGGCRTAHTAQGHLCVDVLFGSEALMVTSPTALGGDAALPRVGSVTRASRFPEPVSSPGRWDL